MNKNANALLFALAVLVLLVLIYKNRQSLKRLELKIGSINNKPRPSIVLLTVQTAELAFNIDSINGNGNAIGNNNTVTNIEPCQILK